MKFTILACLCALITLFTSRCSNMHSAKADTVSETQKLIDSLEIERKADSISKRIVRDALFDTVGVSTAPVKVLSARLVEREYSSYKDMRLTWKNVGTKKIAAVRFMWYGLNAFGEPADMGGHIQKGFGGGYSDDPLGPGKTDAGTWSIMSGDGKKVVLAWPYEIAFEDGTKWSTKK